MKSKHSASSLIFEVILQIAWRAFVSVAAALLLLIPIVGIVLVILVEIGMFFSLLAFILGFIKKLMSYIEITEQGINGKAGFKTLNLSWDDIEMIELYDFELHVFTNQRKKPYIFDDISNYLDLYKEYHRITGKGRDLDREVEEEAARKAAKKAEKEAKKNK